LNRITRSAALLALAGAFTAATLPANADTKTIRIGVTPGPHAQIMDEVARLGAKRGLTIKVIEISDYAVPNQALDAGDLEANSFQNQPYLDDQIKARGYKLTTVAKTILLPMGIYSKKVKRIAELRDGATIGIPNDPTNGARALKLLQTAKLIKLGSNSYTVGVADITDNPKHLNIRSLNAAQLPRSLDDLDAACINGNYAATAGLAPNRDAIVAEGGGVGEALRSPYSNIVAVRAADRDQPWAKQLVALYHSNEIRGFIIRRFGGTIFPAF
jgi:D-methionine transport system substrate-binding protein